MSIGMKHHYTWSWDLGCWIDAWGYGWEFERFGRCQGWTRTIYTRGSTGPTE